MKKCKQLVEAQSNIVVASGNVKQQHVEQNKVVGNIHQVAGEALGDNGKGKHKSKGDIQERKKGGKKRRKERRQGEEEKNFKEGERREGKGERKEKKTIGKERRQKKRERGRKEREQ